MNKLILALLLSSSLASGALVEFSPSEKIKAQQMNNNFDSLKNSLSLKNEQVNFHQYSSGELILKESINEDFDKVRSLGITVDVLENEKIIKAEDLNRLFAQAILGINSFNDVPLANSFSVSVNEDTTFNGPFNFMNVVGVSSIEILSPPAHGTLSNISVNGFSYLGNTDYFGADSFTYRVVDGEKSSSAATVSISVLPINDAPVASSQNISLNEDTSKSVTLSATDIDSSTLSYSIITPPTKGTLTGTLPNLTYVPNLDAFGSDIFTFSTNDGALNSNIATVNISILPINDAPVLSGSQIIAVTQNVVYNGTTTITDPDSSSFSYSLTQNPTKGSVAFLSNGTYTYTPNLNAFGSDSFTVRASDGNLNSNTLAISVSINGSGLVLNDGARNYYDGTFATSCNAYRNSGSGNKTYTGNTGDGLYRVEISGGGTQVVYCDMTTEGGGWTLISSSGTACGSFVQRSSTSPAYPSHTNYSANCGYIAEPAVRSMANVSTSVRLRSGASASVFTQANSTGSLPINALKNKISWNTAASQFNAFSWAINGCPSNSVSSFWPFMYHACGNEGGVHWTSDYHSATYTNRAAVTSTWIK